MSYLFFHEHDIYLSTCKFLGGGGENSYFGVHLVHGRGASRDVLELKNETWNVVGQTLLGRSSHAVSVIQYDDIHCNAPGWNIEEE